MFVMLITALVIVATLNFGAIQSVKSATENTLMSSAAPTSKQAANNFNNTIWQYGSYLSLCMESEIFQEETSSAKQLELMKESYPESLQKYMDFTLFETNGNVIDSTNETVAATVSKEDIKKAADDNDFIVTDLTVFESRKNKIIFSVMNKAKSDGKVIVGCTTVDADSLSSLLASMTGDKTSKGFVVSSDGTTLLHTEKEKALKRLNVIDKGKNDKTYKDAANATKAALKKKNSTGSYELDGVEYVFGAAKVDYFDGMLFCTINTEEYSATSNKTLMYIFLSGSLIMAATVVVAWIFSRRISKPIMSATQRIRQLAQGNLSAPVDVWYSKDETGVLTSSLEETVVCLRQYINLITVALTQISEGNLQHRMEGTFKGDFQQIKNTFNEILEGLCDTFASINTAAEQVTSGAALVSNSAQSVSQGSTQQASAIEELSVTLKDVAKQVEQNSEDAKNAYNIVSQNTEAIGSCNEDMENMLNAINAIHTSSNEISKIIKVIDEIAFQTNILALNAAVEAAREGSKGFGVVADEVRRLASRSAEAAKQTADLIENSAAAVSKGTQIAQKTADSLFGIVESSGEIQGLVKNISDASETQAEAITQINTGLDQISDVVSANTSSSVGTASASEELSSQSLILKNMIARFKLSDSDTPKRSGGFHYDYDDMELDADMAKDPIAENYSDEMFTDSDDDKY